MKASGKCPKCDSSEIHRGTGKAVKSPRSTIHLGLFKSIMVDTFICRSCGYVEEYVREEELEEME